jgi:hypothetical protein
MLAGGAVLLAGTARQLRLQLVHQQRQMRHLRVALSEQAKQRWLASAPPAPASRRRPCEAIFASVRSKVTLSRICCRSSPRQQAGAWHHCRRP